MADHSPATRAIVAAFNERGLAAALRALADQVVPREPMKDPLWASDAYRQRADIRAQLLAIAAELEGRHA